MRGARELLKSEVVALLATAKESRYPERNLAMISICLYSGTRIGESCSLLNEQVLDASGKVKERFQLVKSQTKNNKKRPVYLHKATIKAFTSYLSVKKSFEASRPFFEGQRDILTPIRSNSGQQIIKKLMIKAGIEDASSHSLRKCCANSLRRNGADMEVIRSVLDHSNLSITSAYIRSNPMEVGQAINNIKY